MPTYLDANGDPMPAQQGPPQKTYLDDSGNPIKTGSDAPKEQGMLEPHHDWTDPLRGAAAGIKQLVTHPIDSLSQVPSISATPTPTIYGAPKAQQQAVDSQNKAVESNAADIQAQVQAAKDHPAFTVGQIAGPIILAHGLAKGIKALPDAVSAVTDAVTSDRGGPPGPPGGPPKSGNLKSKWDRATAGPQSTVMPSAAKLPLAAQSGVEDIFRAAAPTSKNAGFRENLNVVAPDLADIARKIDISEAKGGIINPDMRVRATVDAIRSHLDEMVQNERVPQIQRNARLPVKVGTNPNAVRGLEYLEATAGDVADSQLARKAMDGETLNVAEADKLAKVANQTLRSFERMTPEGKMQVQTANPKIGGLKALDNDLRDNLNGVLQANGEKGLYSYERRYAGLSSVLDQLQSRMNATELKQQGLVGAIGQYTRPLLKVIKDGPAGVPSASQAAVSDVNIGRTLQTGLNKLKSSGITASDTTPYPRPTYRPPMLRLPQEAGAKIPLYSPDPGMSSGENIAAMMQQLRSRHPLALPAQSTPIRLPPSKP